MNLLIQIQPWLSKPARVIAVVAALLLASLSCYGAVEAAKESASSTAGTEAFLGSVSRNQRFADRGKPASVFALHSQTLAADVASRQMGWNVPCVIGHRLSNGLMAPLLC